MVGYPSALSIIAALIHYFISNLACAANLEAYCNLLIIICGMPASLSHIVSLKRKKGHKASDNNTHPFNNSNHTINFPLTHTTPIHYRKLFLLQMCHRHQFCDCSALCTMVTLMFLLPITVVLAAGIFDLPAGKKVFRLHLRY